MTRRAVWKMVPTTFSSPMAILAGTFSVVSQPLNPWPDGFPSPGRGARQYWHRSTRCQYFHMLSACHVSSFVHLARSSQSTSCGTMVIMALCAVQPPSVPARGRSEEHTSELQSLRHL